MRDCVRDRRGVSGMDDLILLTMAVLGFSLFFAALAGAYVARQNGERGQRLQDAADALLAAVVDHPRWTASHGLLLAGALDRGSGAELASVAGPHPFRVLVWDLVTGRTWTFEAGPPGGDRRTAATSATVVDAHVDAARVTATVWGP